MELRFLQLLLTLLMSVLHGEGRDPPCPTHCACGKSNIDCSNNPLLTLSKIDPTNDYESVNLSKNGLLWLPSIKAKYLDASSNAIIELPLLFPPIQTLILKNNSIRYIENYECPDSLKHLDLSENPTKQVDLTCNRLETLNLSDGDIEILPENFLSKLMSLQALNIDGNPLKKINGELRSDTLEVLSIQRTQLRYIKPGLFVRLSKLKVINLSGSKYIRTLSLLSSAEVLMANHCALDTVVLSGMSNVRVVEINGNHVNSLVLPDSVLELKASNNIIYDITLKRLKKADLSRNSITSIVLKPMEFLNISGNPLTRLRLPSIQFLDASQCKITYIEAYSSKFHTLNLSYNSLEEFPKHLSARKLDLSYNRLSRFKSNIEEIEEIWLVGNRIVLAEDVIAQGRMHLIDNPWTCDCMMDHLYMKAHDAKKLTCSHPRNVTGRTWSEACYKSRIPKWMLDRPYVPFLVSILLLLIAMAFFCWIRKKFDIAPAESGSYREQQTIAENVPTRVIINNLLPSYEEALLMPSVLRKKNALTQTRSYEVLSKRLSSNSI